MVKRRAILLIPAVAMLAMLAFASPAWAGAFSVDTTQDRIPVARSCTLDANGQTDTVNFALPAGPQTIALCDALTTGDPNDPIPNDLTINAASQNLLTVKQGVELRVLQIVGKTTINGITISGGRSPNNAGGIFNGGILTLNDTTVTDNQALGTQQDTGDGGGIYNANNATLTLNRSTVSANEAYSGGGIYSDTDLTGKTTAIRNSTISGNTAEVRGGGAHNGGGLTAIE